jgi:hypothetical protein
MILTLNDFDKNSEFYIPTQKDSPGLLNFIEREEEDILRKLLGNELYDQFIEGLEGSPASLWIDLLDGDSYDTKYKYRGIKHTITGYVYARWIEETSSRLTNSGFVTAVQTEGTQTVQPMERMVIAWNKFARRAGSHCNRENSLYGFLDFNRDTYENWEWDDPGYMNHLGI